MGELLFIGLGLHDEKGITLRGLEEARSAALVFAELYTSRAAGGSVDAIERLLGKKVRTLSRTEVESGHAILEAAALQKVAFLVVGDPMAATTHVDLRLRAAAANIPTRIIHGASVLTAAAGVLGLQMYKFGRTTTVPFSAPGFVPTSPLEVILENRRAGLHTLVLLDLQEDGTVLAPGDAISAILGMAKVIGTKEMGPQTLVCVLSRVGASDVRAFAGRIGDLEKGDLGLPPHCLVIPGSLHFLEKEALIAFAGAPHDV
jgi:diphthine synthase